MNHNHRKLHSLSLRNPYISRESRNHQHGKQQHWDGNVLHMVPMFALVELPCCLGTRTWLCEWGWQVPHGIRNLLRSTTLSVLLGCRQSLQLSSRMKMATRGAILSKVIGDDCDVRDARLPKCPRVFLHLWLWWGGEEDRRSWKSFV